MSDYVVTNVTSGFEMEVTINKNLNDIKTAMDKLLSREISTDNALEQNLDIGGFRLINLPAATDPTDPVRLSEINSLAVAEVIQVIPFAGAISIDATTLTYGKIVLTGNTTITLTGTPTDGRPLLLTLQQDGTGSRTAAYGASIRFSADVPQPVLSTGANKLDYLLFRFNLDANKFDLLAVNKGF